MLRHPEFSIWLKQSTIHIKGRSLFFQTPENKSRPLFIIYNFSKYDIFPIIADKGVPHAMIMNIIGKFIACQRSNYAAVFGPFT